MFCSVLASLDALPEFGRLVWSVMDLMVLLFFCGCFWRLFSEKPQCWMVLFDLLQYQHQAANFWFRIQKLQIRRNSIHYYSAKFWFRIPMGDEISIHLFCHSLGSRLRLLLRLVKVLLEFGHSGHAAGDCRLGWFRDGSDGAILLLRLLPRTGCVENAWNDRVWRHWFGPSLRPGKPSNSPRWCGGRHDGAEGAISTKQYTCLHWPVNEANCLSVRSAKVCTKSAKSVSCTLCAHFVISKYSMH